MLRACSSALLLSGVPSFVQSMSDIAKDVGVILTSAEAWDTRYRIAPDIVICGSKFLEQIDPADYGKVRLVLKTTETVAPFIQMGITHFIFDYMNRREVAFSFFVDTKEKETKHSSVSDILSDTDEKVFRKGSYLFDFGSDVYKFNGVGLYLRKSEKSYLAQWLLLGEKDNSKRILLYKMRRKFGRDFLSDIDRKGNYRGDCYEQ